ncbi:MAG: ferritin [Clostridia bacterium]|nr:ferritin [Clostridia bacterium]
MISSKIQQLLNEQMRNEFYSAYFYLGMANWFEARNLSGFANWFNVQVKEERDHALRFRNYLIRVDGTPELMAIEEPEQTFKDVEDVLQRTLAHEQFVTSKINELMETAVAENDYKTILFLQWFVVEQTEEEQNVRDLIERLRVANNSDAGVLIMDDELESRKYTPSSTATENS